MKQSPYSSESHSRTSSLLGEAVCKSLGLFVIPDDFVLSVVIPVYNEEKTLTTLVNAVVDVPIKKDSFFKALNASEVKGGALHVSVSIRKATGFFELQFHTEGTVTVPCDLCLDDMSQPIVTDNMLIAKLGAETNTDDDEVVIVDENEGILDTSWLIYEFVADRKSVV